MALPPLRRDIDQRPFDDALQAVEGADRVRIRHPGPQVEHAQPVGVATVDGRAQVADQHGQAARAGAAVGAAAAARAFGVRYPRGAVDGLAGAVGEHRIALAVHAAAHLRLGPAGQQSAGQPHHAERGGQAQRAQHGAASGGGTRGRGLRPTVVVHGDEAVHGVDGTRVQCTAATVQASRGAAVLRGCGAAPDPGAPAFRMACRGRPRRTVGSDSTSSCPAAEPRRRGHAELCPRAQ